MGRTVGIASLIVAGLVAVGTLAWQVGPGDRRLAPTDDQLDVEPVAARDPADAAEPTAAPRPDDTADPAVSAAAVDAAVHDRLVTARDAIAAALDRHDVGNFAVQIDPATNRITVTTERGIHPPLPAPDLHPPASPGDGATPHEPTEADEAPPPSDPADAVAAPLAPQGAADQHQLDELPHGARHPVTPPSGGGARTRAPTDDGAAPSHAAAGDAHRTRPDLPADDPATPPAPPDRATTAPAPSGDTARPPASSAETVPPPPLAAQPDRAATAPAPPADTAPPPAPSDASTSPTPAPPGDSDADRPADGVVALLGEAASAVPADVDVELATVDDITIQPLASGSRLFPPYEALLHVDVHTASQVIRCTSGYAFTDAAAVYGSTAGHCGQVGDTISVGDTVIDTIAINPFQSSSQVEADVALYSLSNRGWPHRPTVRDDAVSRSVVGRLADHEIAEGLGLCFAGRATSAQTCGTVTTAHQVICCDAGNRSFVFSCIDHDALAGDSGGPVFQPARRGVVAAGLLSSSVTMNGQTSMCFSTVDRVEAATGTTLVTAR